MQYQPTLAATILVFTLWVRIDHIRSMDLMEETTAPKPKS